MQSRPRFNHGNEERGRMGRMYDDNRFPTPCSGKPSVRRRPYPTYQPHQPNNPRRSDHHPHNNHFHRNHNNGPRRHQRYVHESLEAQRITTRESPLPAASRRGRWDVRSSTSVSDHHRSRNLTVSSNYKNGGKPTGTDPSVSSNGGSRRQWEEEEAKPCSMGTSSSQEEKSWGHQSEPSSTLSPPAHETRKDQSRERGPLHTNTTETNHCSDAPNSNLHQDQHFTTPFVSSSSSVSPSSSSSSSLMLAKFKGRSMAIKGPSHCDRSHAGTARNPNTTLPSKKTELGDSSCTSTTGSIIHPPCHDGSRHAPPPSMTQALLSTTTTTTVSSLESVLPVAVSATNSLAELSATDSSFGQTSPLLSSSSMVEVSFANRDLEDETRRRTAATITTTTTASLEPPQGIREDTDQVHPPTVSSQVSVASTTSSASKSSPRTTREDTRRAESSRDRAETSCRAREIMSTNHSDPPPEQPPQEEEEEEPPSRIQGQPRVEQQQQQRRPEKQYPGEAGPVVHQTNHHNNTVGSRQSPPNNTKKGDKPQKTSSKKQVDEQQQRHNEEEEKEKEDDPEEETSGHSKDEYAHLPKGDRALVQVGTRVAVYWRGDDLYFTGVVQKTRPHKKKCFYVVYDDGDTEWLSFAKIPFVILSGGLAVVNESTNDTREDEPMIMEPKGDQDPNGIESPETDKDETLVAATASPDYSRTDMAAPVTDREAIGESNQPKEKGQEEEEEHQEPQEKEELLGPSCISDTQAPEAQSTSSLSAPGSVANAGTVTGESLSTIKKKKKKKKKMKMYSHLDWVNDDNWVLGAIKHKASKTPSSSPTPKSEIVISSSSMIRDTSARKQDRGKEQEGNLAIDTMMESKPKTDKASSEKLPKELGDETVEESSFPLWALELGDVHIPISEKVKLGRRRSRPVETGPALSSSIDNKKAPSQVDTSIDKPKKEHTGKRPVELDSSPSRPKKQCKIRKESCPSSIKSEGKVSKADCKSKVLSTKSEPKREKVSKADSKSKVFSSLSASADGKRNAEDSSSPRLGKKQKLLQKKGSPESMNSTMIQKPCDKHGLEIGISMEIPSSEVDSAEAKRRKEEARTLSPDEVRAILGEDFPCSGSSNWVRRSARMPSRAALMSPNTQVLLHKLSTNDEDMVVLKMKKYVSDPATPSVVIDAVLDALEENENCESLYIQNYNEGMKDDQVLRLLAILKRPSCKIWCLNIGETYKVKRKTWKKFARGLRHTKVTHMYASEHTISAELKEYIRATIRDNRKKHNMHVDPNNLDTIVKCTHCWWNPINAKVLRPYLHAKGYAHILDDKEAQGARGTMSAEQELV